MNLLQPVLFVSLLCILMNDAAATDGSGGAGGGKPDIPPPVDPSVPSSPKSDPSVPSLPKADPSVPSAPKADPSVPSSPKADPSEPSSPKADPSVPSSPKADPSVPSSPKGDPSSSKISPEEKKVLYVPVDDTAKLLEKLEAEGPLVWDCFKPDTSKDGAVKDLCKDIGSNKFYVPLASHYKEILLPLQNTYLVKDPVKPIPIIPPSTTTLSPNATVLKPTVTTLSPNVTTLNPNATTLNINTTTLSPNTTSSAVTKTPVTEATLVPKETPTPAPQNSASAGYSGGTMAVAVIFSIIGGALLTIAAFMVYNKRQSYRR